MYPKTTQSLGRWLGLAALAALMVGCSSDERDLQAYIDQVKAKPGRGIEPLPEFRTPPTFTYEAGDRRSPFVPDTASQRVATNPNAVDAPDQNRPREFLEQEPLDGLQMVGTLENKTGMFGLIRDSEGLVHRVQVGNYLGQNNGRITNITDSQIDLTEIIPDVSQGSWIQRPASIALSDRN
jgi:type IV pilus assembly protein PilP